MAVTTVQFLTDGDGTAAFDCDLPDAVLAGQPQMSAGIVLDGARTIVYAPFAQFVDPNANPALSYASETTSRSGAAVRAYETVPQSDQIWAYWTLPDGYLVSYVERAGAEVAEARGFDALQDLAAAISVEFVNGLPRVQYSAPVTGGDPREMFARPLTSYFPPEFYEGEGNSSAWPIVRVRQEPAWVRDSSGAALSDPASAGMPWLEASITVAGVRISCEGPGPELATLESVVTTAAAALQPVG